MTPRHGRRAREESGVALLSALFAVALLTVIVIEMTDATLVHTHLTRNAGNAMAAQLLARSAATAAEAMVGDEHANPRDVTCPQNFWAMPLFGIPAGAGVVGLQITDESGKLDLNAVRDQAYATAVGNLFDALGIDRALVERVAAWIGLADDAAMATGSATDYCALSMPCAPRLKALNSLDELLLIRGFDEQAVNRLRPFVTAFPPASEAAGKAKAKPINLNTAKPEVLAALGCEGGDSLPACPMSLGIETGDKNEKSDKHTEWQADFDAWKAANCQNTPASLQPLLDVKSSNVYSILATGTVGDVTQTLRTVVQRAGNKVTPLWWQERPVSEALPVEVR